MSTNRVPRPDGPPSTLVATLFFPSGDPAKGGEGSARKFFSLVSAERVAELVETNGVRLRFFNCFAFIQCDDI